MKIGTQMFFMVLVTAACSSGPSRGGSGQSGDTAGIGFSPDATAPEDLGDTGDDTGGDDALEDAGDETSVGDPDAADPIDTGSDPTDTGSDPTDTGSDPPDDDLPPPNATADFGDCSEPGGDRNIYDLQNPDCPDHITPEPTASPGVPVTLSGVVASAIFGDTTFVQEVEGGPYSGIAVFTHGMPPIGVEPGTMLDVTGGYYEFFELSQIWLESWEIVGQVDPPQPFLVSHPAHVATGGTMAELFEGVLIRTPAVKTIHTKPDCPHEYGEFLVSGDLRIDDMGVLWDARLGDEFASITGALTYTFDNFKLEPRNDADLDVLTTGGASSTSKCIESDCIVPKSIVGTHQIIVNEIMIDPLENDTGQEWIELYNPGSEAVSVDGWELRDCGDQKLPLVGESLVIEPGGYLVLAASTNPATNGDVPADLAYGDGFYLPNTVGAVILFDGTNEFAEVVDQTRYSRFDDWQGVFVTGRSLSRLGSDSDGTLPTSWAPAQSTFGSTENKGTPGAKNDVP